MSNHAGLLYIQANYNNIFLSETYEVQDCIKYDANEHTYNFNNSLNQGDIYVLSDLTDFSLEMDVYSSATHQLVTLATSAFTKHIGYGSGNSNEGTRWVSLDSDDSYPCGSYLTSYYTLKWVTQSTTMKLYLNDTLITDVTHNSVPDLKHLKYSSWSSKTLKYKNLKIKSL